MNGSLSLLLPGFLLLILLSACGPDKPAWQFKERILIEGMRPYGIAWHDGELHCSSREDNLIVVLNKDQRVVKRITEYPRPMRMNRSGNSLIITEFDGNRIAMRAGEETLYYPLVQKLDGPMAADFYKNRIAVADYNKHRIVYFSGSENLTFGEEGSGQEQFSYPTDIQIYNEHLYIADNQNRRIQVYDARGKFVRSIGLMSGIRQASGLFIYKGGILLCDRKGQQVVWFDHEGNMIQRIDQGFEKPSDAVVVGSRMYVADEAGGSVTILDLK